MKKLIQKNLIDSYSDLKELFISIDLWAKKKYRSKRFLSDAAKVGIGCCLLTGTIKKIEFFYTNRYILDAVGANEIPKYEALNSIPLINEINEYFEFIPKSKNCSLEIKWIDVTKSIFKKFIKRKLLDVSKFWGENEKNFFLENGYVIIPDFIEKSMLNTYKKEIYKIAETERDKKAAFFYGPNNKGQRVYNLINKTHLFDNLLLDNRIDHILKEIFHRNTFHQLYTMSSWHANFLHPGAIAQKLHADASVPDPLPPWMIRTNISFVVEDQNFKNGGTLCLPKSHLKFRHPTTKDFIKYRKKLITLEAAKGSIIIWSGHLWHQSGNNESKKTRAALLACYSASYLLEVALEENHPLIISKSRRSNIPTKLKKLFALKHGIKSNK